MLRIVLDQDDFSIPIPSRIFSIPIPSRIFSIPILITFFINPDQDQETRYNIFYVFSAVKFFQ